MRGLLLSCFLAGACAGSPSPESAVEPLPVTARFEVDYAGAIDTELGQALLPEAMSGRAEKPDDGPQVRIDARILRLPAATARRLFGLEGAEGGRLPSASLHAAFDRLVADQVAEEVSAPSLLTAVGRTVTTASARQLPLVRGYDLSAVDLRFVGDLRIESVEVGMALEVTAQEIGSGEALEMSILVRVTDMVGSPRRLGGSFDSRSGFALQVPVACHQRMAATAVVGPEEALYLTGLLVPGSDDVLIVSIDGQRIDLGATPK
jgi:hypothetical protein